MSTVNFTYEDKRSVIEWFCNVTATALAEHFDVDDIEFAFFGINSGLNIVKKSGGTIQRHCWMKQSPDEDHHLELFNIPNRNLACGGIFIRYKTSDVTFSKRQYTYKNSRYVWVFLPLAWFNPMCRSESLTKGAALNVDRRFLYETEIPIVNNIHANTFWLPSKLVMIFPKPNGLLNILDKIYGTLIESSSYLDEEFGNLFEFGKDYWITNDDLSEKIMQVINGSLANFHYVNIRVESETGTYHIPNCLLNLHSTELEVIGDYLYLRPNLKPVDPSWSQANWIIQNYPYFGLSENESWDRSGKKYEIVETIAINPKKKLMFLVKDDTWFRPTDSEYILGVIKSCHEISTKQNQLHHLI